MWASSDVPTDVSVIPCSNCHHDPNFVEKVGDVKHDADDKRNTQRSISNHAAADSMMYMHDAQGPDL